MSIVPLAASKIPIGGLPSNTLYTGSLSTTDTYTVPLDRKTFLHFRKSGAGICTVTLVTPAKLAHLTYADRTFTVPASTGDVLVGNLDPDLYMDPATGLMTFSCSDITGLTVGIFHYD